MPNTVTIPKTEYQRLRWAARRFDVLRKVFELEFFEEPPTRDTKAIIKELRASGHHAAFLKSLERGLKESAYFSS